MPFELSNVAYLYLFISTFPPIIVRHDMNSCFHTYYLSTNHSQYSCPTPGPEPLGQRQRQRHKLKHQPIHYQGSSCDNHKVNVCIQFVCTNEFSPLQIRMTFICEIIHNNFFLLFGRPIFTFSILYSGAKQKKTTTTMKRNFARTLLFLGARECLRLRNDTVHLPRLVRPVVCAVVLVRYRSHCVFIVFPLHAYQEYVYHMNRVNAARY